MRRLLQPAPRESAGRYTDWESRGCIAGFFSLVSTDFMLSVRERVIRNGHTARREQLSPADNAPAWLDTVSFQGRQNRARVPLVRPAQRRPWPSPADSGGRQCTGAIGWRSVARCASPPPRRYNSRLRLPGRGLAVAPRD